MFTPSIQSLSEAYQEVYEGQEGRRSPEERKARGKELGDRQTVRKVVGDYNKGRSDTRKEDPEKYITKEEVIGYLMDEGYVNNEVSAEIFIEHMSDEWLESVVEAFQPLSDGGKTLLQKKVHELRPDGPKATSKDADPEWKRRNKLKTTMDRFGVKQI